MYQKFIPSTNWYNGSNALVCARAASATYELDVVEEAILGPGAKKKAFCSADGVTSGWVFHNDKAVVVALRGTRMKEGKDWLQNLKILDDRLSLRGKDYKSHAGFLSSARHAWDRLQGTLTRLVREEDRKLYITGHSKGGAEAWLLGALCWDAQLPVQGIYTFGAPSCVHNDLAKDFPCRNTFSLINNLDIVPGVLSPSYHPVGQLIYFHDNGATSYADGFAGRVLMSIHSFFASANMGVSVGQFAVDKLLQASSSAPPWRDHDMDNYIRAIEQRRVYAGSPARQAAVQDFTAVLNGDKLMIAATVAIQQGGKYNVVGGFVHKCRWQEPWWLKGNQYHKVQEIDSQHNRIWTVKMICDQSAVTNFHVDVEVYPQDEAVKTAS